MKRWQYFNMKKLIGISFVFSMIAGFITACDIIDAPYVEDNVYQSNGRKILLEDFTGHRCGNCPRAHEELQNLIVLFHNDIIPISVHAGFYALPLAGFTADYRTTAGNELDALYHVSASGLPKGLINRKEYEGNRLLCYSQWRKAASEWLSEKPGAKIEIETVLNPSRDYSVKITSRFVKDFPEALNLSVYLTEDSVLSPQSDYQHDPDVIENYYHRYVLRKALSPTFGIHLCDQALNGSVFENSFSSVLDTTYFAAHCYIVAFVSLNESGVVIQADMTKLVDSK